MDGSIRAARLADQIRDYLAVWTRHDLEGSFFTITEVTLTPDLARVTAWVEVTDPSKAVSIVHRLNTLHFQYQRRLHRALQRKTMLALTFSLDTSRQLNERFDQLLKDR